MTTPYYITSYNQNFLKKIKNKNFPDTSNNDNDINYKFDRILSGLNEYEFNKMANTFGVVNERYTHDTWIGTEGAWCQTNAFGYTVRNVYGEYKNASKIFDETKFLQKKYLNSKLNQNLGLLYNQNNALRYITPTLTIMRIEANSDISPVYKLVYTDSEYLIIRPILNFGLSYKQFKYKQSLYGIASKLESTLDNYLNKTCKFISKLPIYRFKHKRSFNSILI